MKSQHLLTTTCNLLILCNNIEITQSLPIINYVQVSTQYFNPYFLNHI